MDTNVGWVLWCRDPGSLRWLWVLSGWRITDVFFELLRCCSSVAGVLRLRIISMEHHVAARFGAIYAPASGTGEVLGRSPDCFLSHSHVAAGGLGGVRCRRIQIPCLHVPRGPHCDDAVPPTAGDDRRRSSMVSRRGLRSDWGCLCHPCLPVCERRASLGRRNATAAEVTRRTEPPCCSATIPAEAVAPFRNACFLQHPHSHRLHPQLQGRLPQLLHFHWLRWFGFVLELGPIGGLPAREAHGNKPFGACPDNRVRAGFHEPPFGLQASLLQPATSPFKFAEHGRGGRVPAS
mmetsp:Transcript_64501/g.151551  ORF Transcript_64501/g.151551 Transcript_64501/m.151551 type:complete len:292 (+) Transcript_64501:388-1263(+)